MLPFGKGQEFATHGLANALAGGFQLTGILTAQSGVPLGVLQSGANGLGLGAYRPDKIGNAVTQHPRNSNGSVQWINTAAYKSLMVILAQLRFETASCVVLTTGTWTSASSATFIYMTGST